MRTLKYENNLKYLCFAVRIDNLQRNFIVMKNFMKIRKYFSACAHKNFLMIRKFIIFHWRNRYNTTIVDQQKWCQQFKNVFAHAHMEICIKSANYRHFVVEIDTLLFSACAKKIF